MKRLNSTTISTYELGKFTKDVLDQVERGEEITIKRAGKIVAKIVNVESKPTPRVLICDDCAHEAVVTANGASGEHNLCASHYEMIAHLNP